MLRVLPLSPRSREDEKKYILKNHAMRIEAHARSRAARHEAKKNAVLEEDLRHPPPSTR